MGIERQSPKISLLKLKVETIFDRSLKVHNDFVVLASEIEAKLKQHISETTLERVWGYSMRGYDSVSLHTLNLLCRYAGFESWTKFCESIQEEGIKDSDLFEGEGILSSSLSPGDMLKIGWLPDRECIIKYCGDYRFIAVECKNATMKKGDTFSCIEFRKNQPAVMDNFISVTDPTKTPRRYIAGVKHGLNLLSLLKP